MFIQAALFHMHWSMDLSNTILNQFFQGPFPALETCSNHWRPLCIWQKFLSSLAGQNPFSDTHRDLMAIPVCLGRLGIIDHSIWITVHYCASQKITDPLIELIYKQSHTYASEIRATQAKIKNSAHNLHWQWLPPSSRPNYQAIFKKLWQPSLWRVLQVGFPPFQ